MKLRRWALLMGLVTTSAQGLDVRYEPDTVPVWDKSSHTTYKTRLTSGPDPVMGIMQLGGGDFGMDVGGIRFDIFSMAERKRRNAYGRQHGSLTGGRRSPTRRACACGSTACCIWTTTGMGYPAMSALTTI